MEMVPNVQTARLDSGEWRRLQIVGITSTSRAAPETMVVGPPRSGGPRAAQPLLQHVVVRRTTPSVERSRLNAPEARQMVAGGEAIAEPPDRIAEQHPPRAGRKTWRGKSV